MYIGIYSYSEQQGYNWKQTNESKTRSLFIINDGIYYAKYLVFHKAISFFKEAESELTFISEKYEEVNLFILDLENNLTIIEKQGPKLEESRKLLEQGKEQMFNHNFTKALDLANKAEDIAKETSQTYASVNDDIRHLKTVIEGFKEKGIKTEEFELMLDKAEKEVGK